MSGARVIRVYIRSSPYCLHSASSSWTGHSHHMKWYAGLRCPCVEVFGVILSDVVFFLAENGSKYTFFSQDNKVWLFSLITYKITRLIDAISFQELTCHTTRNTTLIVLINSDDVTDPTRQSPIDAEFCKTENDKITPFSNVVDRI